MILVAAALQAAASFAPPLDRPIRLTIAEARTADGKTRRYATERRIVFHARPGGFLAEIATVAGSSDDGTTAGALVEAGLAALGPTPIVLELDAAGTVTAVRDRETIWAAMVDGMDRALARRSAGAGPGAVLAALRILPAERQLAVLTTLMAPLVARDAGVHAPQPITIETRTPDGAAATLTGTERVYRDADDRLVTERSADGAAPDGSRVAITLERRADEALGLVVDSRQTTRVQGALGALTIVRTVDVR